MGLHRVWQSIPYACPKSGLQEVSGYLQQEELLPSSTNTGRNSKLKDYRYKLGQCDSNKCTCGETETPKHILIDCPNYQHYRETMQLKLSFQHGLNFLDAHTLLSNEEYPELPDWRETIRQEVAAYIEATGRFSKENPDRPPPNL